MNNSYYDEAKKKLDEGLKEKCDRYGDAMKEDVRNALLEFCRQDNEFAQAVVQGGSFKDCMAAVAKGVHNGSISDMAAYGCAVEFFFPGAGINVTMTIDLCASVRSPDTDSTSRNSVVIDLSNFF